MKVQLLIPATLLVSVALVPIMKMRKKEQFKQEKLSMVMRIKLRVTADVLKDYEQEKEAISNNIKQKLVEIKDAEAQLSTARQVRDQNEKYADDCEGQKVRMEGL